MSITTTFALGRVKVPAMFNSVSMAGLQQFFKNIFPMAGEKKITAASRPLSNPQQCPECKTELGAANEVYSRIAVCDYCGYHFVWPAPNRVEHLADPGTFRPIGHLIQSVDFLGFVDEHPYSTRLISGQKQTGLSDAILSGRCRIGDIETVLAVLDFRFMGGSMGSVVGEHITFAFEYATRHHLRVVTVVNSGGARLQEGIISLMQMPKTAAAVQRFHTSGLFYLSILASPTTGGVFASFASLGDVILARHPDRPTAREYIRYLSPDFLELQGDRCYGDDPTVVAGLGYMDGRIVMFVGQESLHKSHDSHVGEIQTRPQPQGYRKAMRMMDLAALLHCPLVTFVDSSGADPGDERERHGIAWSMAHCLSAMSSLPVPIVTAIIGEGASGGAVALAVADHVLMLQNAIYEVIAPEGAATILYRDALMARQVAEQLKLTASDCLELGVVDAIISEPLTGAHTGPTLLMQALQQHLLHAVTGLEQVSVKQLLARRYHKFRRHGRFQRRQYLLTRTSMLTGGQGQSFLHQLKDWLPLARISRLRYVHKKSALEGGLHLTSLS